MFFERFVELCKERQVKPSRVALEIGLTKSAVTRWKDGAVPNSDALTKIADFFNVTVDYLLGKSDQKEKPTSEEASLDDPMYILNRGAKKMTDDEKERLLKLAKAAFDDVFDDE